MALKRTTYGHAVLKCVVGIPVTPFRCGREQLDHIAGNQDHVKQIPDVIDQILK
jgi:hypothetical protein